MLCMIAAESNKLLADWTVAFRLPLAYFRVRDDTFHLLARRQAAVCVATLARVDKGLYASLDGQFARFLRVGLLHVARGCAYVDV